DGQPRIVTTNDVNVFLREIAGVKISLKDFRTLCASAAALEALAQVAPAASERGRRRQVKEAVTAVSEELANTPTICRKSYVHQTLGWVLLFAIELIIRIRLLAARDPRLADGGGPAGGFMFAGHASRVSGGGGGGFGSVCVLRVSCED